jgi:TorA maturation chaperone TorD
MSSPSVADFGVLAASDLDMLLVLHDREIDELRWHQLKAVDFPRNLGLQLESEWGVDAKRLLQHALGTWATEFQGDLLEELAADYAAIYLNNSYHAPPYESVWLDEDGLMMQQPMFDVREWYAQHDLEVSDWRKRTDDHLSNELGFVSYLLAGPENRLEEAARFLDEHLLRWLPEFGGRIAQRADTPFYAGLAALTMAYVDELRDVLSDILGAPRPTREEVEERLKPKPEVKEVPLQYMPGATPSW